MRSLESNQDSSLLLKANIAKVHERISQASLSRPDSNAPVRLVAVTKTVSAAVINTALTLGIQEIGENRLQEATQKRPEISPQPNQPLIHHLLGSLQTNKARKAVELFNVIQSVDRPKLAEFLNRVAGELGKIQACLIEVKISEEASKSGMPLNQSSDFIQSFSQYKNLKLRGLMTIAPLNGDEKTLRQKFQNCYRLFDQEKKHFNDQPILSMGMTDDFEMAIAEGSTMVRVGRGLFGERDS